jgi:Amt family ammonium transporter
MGFVGGVVCFFAATSLKHALGYDDSLDAFGVHGVGGTLGAILTGVFAQAFFNPAIKSGTFNYEGLLFGGGQLKNQLIATVITWVIAVIGAFVLLKITDVLSGLRVTEADEFDGLDITQHGERGYNLEEEFGGTVVSDGGALAGTAVAGAGTKVMHA